MNARHMVSFVKTNSSFSQTLICQSINKDIASQDITLAHHLIVITSPSFHYINGCPTFSVPLGCLRGNLYKHTTTQQSEMKALLWLEGAITLWIFHVTTLLFFKHMPHTCTLSKTGMCSLFK